MNRKLRKLVSVGFAGAAVSLSSTAFAQAWSHSSIKSYTAQVAPGEVYNAGFTVSGEGSEGAGAQAGGGRSTQQNSFWAKLDDQTRTIASLRSFANAHAVWGVSQSTNTSLSATLFGQSVAVQNANCTGSTTCSSSRSGFKTGAIIGEQPLWVIGIEGLTLEISGELRGSGGYAFVAQATSQPLGGFAEMTSRASNGANAHVELITKGKVIVGPWDFSVKFIAGTKVDIVRANFAASVSDRMKVNSRTDLDVSWSNTAPFTLSSLGGSVIVQACGPFGACTPEAVVHRWKGFSTTQNGYHDVGSLNDQRF